MNDIVARVILNDINMLYPEYYKQIYDFIHNKEDLEKGIKWNILVILILLLLLLQ